MTSTPQLIPLAPTNPSKLQEWIWGSDADRSLSSEEEDDDEDSEHEDNKLHRGQYAVFFDWKTVFPQIRELIEAVDAIRGEAEAMEKELRFTPWPEANLYNRMDQTGDWKVVPLLYTFPARDVTKMKWVTQNCVKCPITTTLLKRIPGVRTALFSRMGPSTRLSSHRGWADLANHVLRCHIPLRVPQDRVDACGVWVQGQITHHRIGQAIVFDDSCLHKAFNASHTQDRIVLIFDILRPDWCPKGHAKLGHTEALDTFINDFQAEMDKFAT